MKHIQYVNHVQFTFCLLIFFYTAKGFETEEEMLSYLANETIKNTTFLGGITFDMNMSDPHRDPTKYKYSIRLSSSPRNAPYTVADFSQSESEWQTGKLFTPLLISIPRHVDVPWGGTPCKCSASFVKLDSKLKPTKRANLI